MSERRVRTINFIKKNIYYFVFLICLSIITLITVALVVSANSNSTPVNGGNNNVIENPNDDNENQTPQEKPDDTPTDKPNDTPTEKPDDTPTATVIVFDMPVNGTIIKEYVAAGVVYNQTLGVYTGHKAIDFAAEEGALVSACYDGVIESITSGKLEGTTLTIDHGNGLKTIYNSIEVDENISVGNRISKGDTIGTVSTNNRKEFKDGAHLHFEVLENGVKINPEKYLLIEEK